MKTPNSYTYAAAHDGNDYSSAEDDGGDALSSAEDGSPNHNLPQNNGNFYNYDYSKRHPKKRKLESFVSNYEFAPRRETWTEKESDVLLEAWGERFVELGCRSLRAEDWAELAEKVAEMTGVERTESECRSQFDAMKNKYKKERAKVESSGYGSKWVFYERMDELLNPRTREPLGLGCGVDSGEYVFMNPRVYLDRSNVLDEMRDSPGQSDEDEEGDDDEELGGDGDLGDGGESARVLAESIQRFGEIYEKIEESKRKQMVELETMRQDFQRDLELQKKQIVERAQAEIAKIREMDEDDDGDDNTDTSVENFGD